MAPRDPRLQLRGNRWHVRVKVPKVLREAGIIKRREFTRALGTSDFHEARRLLPLELVRIDAEIAAARRKLSGTVARILSRSEMEHLAVQLFHQKEVRRLRATPGGPDALTHQEADDDVADWLDALRDPTDDDARNVVRNAATRMLADIGVELDTASSEWLYFETLIRRVHVENVRRSLRAHRQDYSEAPGDALFKDVDGVKAAPVSVPSLTLGEAWKRWRNSPDQMSQTPKTRLTALSKDGLLLEVLGADRPLASLARQDGARLLDLLSRYPGNASKRWPGKAAHEVVALAEAAGLAPMSKLTVKSYLSAARTFFDFAVKRGLREDNPLQGLSAGSDGVAAKDRRRPFSKDQLARIFHSPLYVGCLDDERGYAIPGPNQPRRGRFWVPLLSLMHGLRLGEACQLHVSDVTVLDGFPVLLIRETDEDGEDTDKRIKTAAGHRFVPLHPEAVSIGFLEYVEAVRHAGSVRLFSELPAATGSGSYADLFSKFFTRFLRNADATRPRTSFHSFRHSYKDALSHAGISLERQRALGGWSSGRVEDAYGDGLDAPTLARDMAKLRFPVDLSHLHVAPAAPPAA